MNEKEEDIIKRFQEASDEMLNSLENNNLTKDEAIEWYGYLRGVRDCAFDVGILNKTTIQENLEKALGLLDKILKTT